METLKAIESRLSINHFDPNAKITREEIEKIVGLAQHTPTSYNLQNWRVIAYVDPEEKARLREAAYGQAKVSEASATLVIVGDVQGVKHLRSRWQPAVEAGLVTNDIVEYLEGSANGLYSNAQYARDEAVRSGAFAAMTIMLAAADLGYGTGPMIGFDPKAVSELADLKEHEIPVLLLALGKPGEGNWPRKPRISLGEQLSFV